MFCNFGFKVKIFQMIILNNNDHYKGLEQVIIKKYACINK